MRDGERHINGGTVMWSWSHTDVFTRDPFPYNVGLSNEDVSQRRAFHGANELSTSEDEPWWAKFLEKFKEPMIALLLGSAAVSLLTSQYDDAISISLVRAGWGLAWYW